MKIVLFVNKDLEANLAYNLLKSELMRHTVRVYYSESVGKGGAKPEELVRLEHFEKSFFFETLTPLMESLEPDCSFEFLGGTPSHFRRQKRRKSIPANSSLTCAHSLLICLSASGLGRYSKRRSSKSRRWA